MEQDFRLRSLQWERQGLQNEKEGKEYAFKAYQKRL